MKRSNTVAATSRAWLRGTALAWAPLAFLACVEPEKDQPIAETTGDPICASATAACTCGGSPDGQSNVRGADGSCAEYIITSPFASAIDVAGDYDWYTWSTPPRAGC